MPVSAEYTSFLVRLWREPDQEQPEAVANWQGEVEHIQSGQRRTFDTLDETLGFLRRQTVVPDEANQTPGKREEAAPGGGAPGPLPLLAGLLDTLDLLTSQARAYERALPPGNFPARAAAATLGELEIALKGTWQHRDLTAAAGAPVTYPAYSQPMAYRRSDGVSMVVYRGTDDHIHSLYLELVRQGNTWQEVWHWADLSAITGSPAAASEPYGYVRSDGISTVMYTGSDGHIHELRLETSWIWADLTSISGAPAAGGRPIAYVRGDGINAVIFKGSADGHIYELRLDDGWQWADLTTLSGAPLPMAGLAACVRSDGISTINYTGYDGHVHDIRLETDWIWADLTAISGAPGTGSGPYSYVRGDGINAIVYATAGADPGRVYELRLDNGWQYYELTSVSNAVRGYRPVGYVRADGISTVVYLGTDWHIHEIRLQTAWQWADLTYLAGAPAADGPPWPYNRSVVARVYLPLVVRQR